MNTNGSGSPTPAPQGDFSWIKKDAICHLNEDGKKIEVKIVNDPDRHDQKNQRSYVEHLDGLIGQTTKWSNLTPISTS